MHNFVTGFAHSGTRVVQRLLYNSGIHVGDVKDLNQTYDDGHTLPDWNNSTEGILNEEEFKEHFELFRQANDNWSLKNCEIMLPPNLELIDKSFEDYTMVLVMRNPIDNILIELNWPEVYPHITKDFAGDFWVKRMKFYIYLHKYFFEFFRGRKNLYIMILENMVANPKIEIRKLFSFLRCGKPNARLSKLVEKPISIGKRYKHYIHHSNIYCPHSYNFFSQDVSTIKDLVLNNHKHKDFSRWDLQDVPVEEFKTKKESHLEKW